LALVVIRRARLAPPLLELRKSKIWKFCETTSFVVQAHGLKQFFVVRRILSITRGNTCCKIEFSFLAKVYSSLPTEQSKDKNENCITIYGVRCKLPNDKWQSLLLYTIIVYLLCRIHTSIRRLLLCTICTSNRSKFSNDIYFDRFKNVSKWRINYIVMRTINNNCLIISRFSRYLHQSHVVPIHGGRSSLVI